MDGELGLDCDMFFWRNDTPLRYNERNAGVRPAMKSVAFAAMVGAIPEATRSDIFS
jgi:hypothetical protein